MATLKQKKAATNLIKNGGNVSKAMVDAGYSKATANTPQKLTESIGYKEIMAEAGLTPQFLVEALVEDIKRKPGRRIQEINTGGRWVGLEKMPDQVTPTDTNNTQINIIGGDVAQEFAEMLANRTKASDES